jgi:hypothetical protein
MQGQSGSFSVGAGGDTPLTYQWRFNGAAVAGATTTTHAVLNASSTNAGAYDAIVSNAYGSITSSVAQLTVLVPPTISTQPTNQTVVAGANALFSAIASGTAPLAYQWWFNATNSVGNDTNMLSLENAQLSMAGGYTVIVTNLAGAATSVVAQLTVVLPPAIVTEPTNITSLAGGAADFVAAAVGTGPLVYQWSFNGTALVGATGNALHLTNLQPSQAGSYVLVATNVAGSASSASANLRVLVAPYISTPAPAASAVSMSVSSVVGLSYSLEYKDSLTDPSWTVVTAPLQGTGAIIVLQDTNTSVATRFYRVRCQ